MENSIYGASFYVSAPGRRTQNRFGQDKNFPLSACKDLLFLENVRSPCKKSNKMSTIGLLADFTGGMRNE